MTTKKELIAKAKEVAAAEKTAAETAEYNKKALAQPIKYTTISDPTLPDVKMVLIIQGKPCKRIFGSITEARQWFKDNVAKFREYEAYATKAGYLCIHAVVELKKPEAPKTPSAPKAEKIEQAVLF